MLCSIEYDWEGRHNFLHVQTKVLLPKRTYGPWDQFTVFGNTSLVQRVYLSKSWVLNSLVVHVDVQLVWFSANE